MRCGKRAQPRRMFHRPQVGGATCRTEGEQVQPPAGTATSSESESQDRRANPCKQAAENSREEVAGKTGQNGEGSERCAQLRVVCVSLSVFLRSTLRLRRWVPARQSALAHKSSLPHPVPVIPREPFWCAACAVRHCAVWAVHTSLRLRLCAVRVAGFWGLGAQLFETMFMIVAVCL